MKPDFAPIDEFVQQRLSELEAPSIVIGVSHRGETVYEGAFGYADMEARRAATCNTPYSLASITKPILGTALAILEQRGKLAYDCPANDYLFNSKLTAWEGSANDATVARLANHTSGLPMYFQFYFEDEEARPPLPSVTIGRYGNIVRPPGESYVYSNIGFGILGFMVEELSGRSQERFFWEEIFEPLGMSQSRLAPTAGELPDRAVRYDKNRCPLPHYVTNHPAASEAYASVYDLLRFGQAHIVGSSVLSLDSIKRMQSPISSLPVDQNYGIGWALSTAASGHRIVQHSGGMDGVNTRLVLVPDDELVIVVMSNFDSPVVQETLMRIYEAYGIRFDESTPAEKSLEVPREVVGSWCGGIHTDAGVFPLTLDVEASGKVAATVNGKHVASDAQFQDGGIQGKIEASIETPDASRTPHNLLVDLRFRGDRLSGAVTARSLPGERIGNAIAYPARLDAV